MKANKQKSKNLKLEQEQFIEIEETKKNNYRELLKTSSQQTNKPLNDIVLNFLSSNNNAQQLIQIKKLEASSKLLNNGKKEINEFETVKIIIDLIYYVQFVNGSKNASANKSMSQVINSILLTGNKDLVDLVNEKTAESLSKLLDNNYKLSSVIFAISFLVDISNLVIPQENINTFKFINIIQEKLSQYCSNLELSSNTDTLTLYDCEHTLRGLVILFNRFSNIIRINLLENVNSNNNSNENLVFRSMQSLSKQLERILSNSTFPRQLGTNAGYLVSEIIILYSNDTESSQKQILSSLTKSDEPSNTSILDILNQSENSFYSKFIKFPEINQISILRGLCLTGNIYSSLTKPIYNKLNENIFLNIIYKGICEYSIGSVDQHNRFISLEYFDLCLSKIKEWLVILEQEKTFKKEDLIQNIFPNLNNYEDFFKNFFNMGLELVWRNWESTINNISTLATEVFDLLLTIHFKCCDVNTDNSNSSLFIKNITIRLIDEDWYQKNKYILLKYILERVGAIFMINLRGNFLKNIFSAMIDHTICNSVRVFLELFIEQLKLDFKPTNEPNMEVKEGELTKIEQYWIYPLLEVLTETDSVTSSRIIVYALPVLLKVFPESLFKILDILINRSSGANQDLFNNINYNIRLRISLALLNSSRQLSLIDGRKLQSKYYDLIEKSLQNQDESLRLLGLELVCVSPKQTERVTIRELKLIKNFILLNLKGSSPFIRNQSLSTLFRFWLRLRESCCKVFRAQSNTNISIEKDDANASADDRYMTIEDLIDYINWSCQLFTYNIYPDAPFPRKMLPLEAFSQFVDIWSSKCNNTPEKKSLFEFLEYVEKKSVLLYSRESTEILVNNLWDNYDRCREVSTDILLKFPSPLPGMESEEKIIPFLLWAVKLACSPKARECDTGAFALKLYLKKYVIPNGLVPIFHSSTTNPVTFTTHSDINTAILEFISQILRILKSQTRIANKSLLEAAKFAPMHGLILSLRYVLAEISFQDINKNPEQKKQWKNLVAEIIELMKLVSGIVLRVVADLAPEGNNPNQAKLEQNDNLPNSLPSGVIYDDDERLANNFASSVSMADEEFEDNEDQNDEEEEEGGDLSEEAAKSGQNLQGGVGQIITVCSWQCTKQISLVLGTILDRVDMPSKESEDSQSIITTQQIEDIGDQFFTILLQSRHKGAIEKTYLGFQVLCSTLMKSSNTRLNCLPSKWINFLFERVKEQSLQITRRSAGLPFAFIGILTGESTSHLRVHHLLHQVMENLLTLAGNTDEAFDSNEPNNNVEKNIYLPQVHSINILKSIFRAKAIIQELDQYLARTLITVIKAFSSKSWSVRNSATMAFSVLVDRIIGTKKLKADNSIINTTTFYHFFSRMPSVYSFLLDYFKRSLTFIKENTLIEEGKIIQSSVYAILVLFSRLQPSNIDHPNDPLAPAAFVPLISQCCQFSNYMVRQISARALVPLISTIELIPFVRDLLKKLNFETTDKSNINTNKVHGILLQIYHLVKGHLPTINPKEREQTISTIVSEFIPEMLWITESKTLPLGFIFYSILIELQKNSSNLLENQQEIISPIIEKSKSILLTNKFDTKVTCLPMFYTWIESISEFVLVDLKRQCKNDTTAEQRKQYNEILMKLFLHSLYEIKIFTMKFLLKNQKIVNQVLDQQELQNQIIRIILNDPNINCRKKAFKLLSFLSLPLSIENIEGTNNTQSNINFYELLCNTIWGQSNSMKKESIIIFGHYLKQFYQQRITENISLNEQQIKVLDNWVKMVKEFSQIHQPLELRQAITEAIEACGDLIFTKLSIDNQLLSKVAIESWFALSLLIDDDDEPLRDFTAILASRVIYLVKNPSSSTINDSEIVIMEGSKCLEEIFSNLTLQFSNYNDYILSRYVDILNINKKNIFNEDFQNSKVLFDKEKDNYFEEQLVKIQLINQQIERMDQSKTPLNHLKEKLMDSLLTCTSWLKNTRESNSTSALSHWLTFNQDVFTNFYTYLVTLSSIIANENSNTDYSEFLSNIKSNLSTITIHPVLVMALDTLIEKINTKNSKLPINYYFLTSKQQ
ncbi:hypothetical protein DICPUDRAFT_153668 [Dictyostelium purpureum]|uniref:Uncharacterized protein n=1 Tax=Dictyostelium purpureum TaxID=5786 RepID=F0ZPG6_DICPU|nr:uncharacterized protein DICPUDRAFT_153668 [Dictyostelium purpureum]EGC34153.1 hypothetical protein DICPUDRAFT_153668 [Dictyostelium purpureum]|eukprot:XP_003289307.1 hypothetical protein DICPUDRAFT_153668 [Dictyostelium purpureum]